MIAQNHAMIKVNKNSGMIVSEVEEFESDIIEGYSRSYEQRFGFL